MKIEKIKQYSKEERGEWWFYPLWKKILYLIVFPFIMLWCGFCWTIMKIGRIIYQFGDLLSGNKWNNGNWLEEI